MSAENWFENAHYKAIERQPDDFAAYVDLSECMRSTFPMVAQGLFWIADNRAEVTYKKWEDGQILCWNIGGIPRFVQEELDLLGHPTLFHLAENIYLVVRRLRRILEIGQ